MHPHHHHPPPEANYTFTIPSIHDDTTLSCRIYHPESLIGELIQDESDDTVYRRRGIVMAHPYAPMGGSYDDRVVGIVVEQFLRARWIVGTFNFRGAQGSAGRTSWSGKPEVDDYASFAACFVHYMSYIQPEILARPRSGSDSSPDTLHSNKTKTKSKTKSKLSPVIVLGGYSYGSLILRNLPPLPAILHPFTHPFPGSAASEILLRAHKLAEQSNTEWTHTAARSFTQTPPKRGRKGHEHKLALTMGGEETSPEKRRSSRDVRRSLEGSAGQRIKTRLRSMSHRRREDDGSGGGAGSPTTPSGLEADGAEKDEDAEDTFLLPEIRYLLISPLTPPISTLLAPALGHKFWHRSRDGAHEIVSKHPTLAIYGDQDMFTSARRVRDWAESLRGVGAASLESVEVQGAGHFWHEREVGERLRYALVEWEQKIC